MSNDPRGRAWLEVDGSALRRNLREVAGAAGASAGVIPMVKADAYGVGMREAIRWLDKEEPWGFGVATVAEGEVAVQMTGRPVVIFSPIPPGEVERAVRAGLRVTVSDTATLGALTRAAHLGPAPRFHVEIDTGMGRAGLDPSTVGEWDSFLASARAAGAVWEGVYTHLHSADEAPPSIDPQVERFRRAVLSLGAGPSVLRHVLNSAGSFARPQYGFDLVRPGIFLYGGRPGTAGPVPEPVVSLRARIVHVKEARPGDTVGYGSTHRARGRERWATVALGYGDGLPRALSNRGSALIGGQRVPIIGRISMDVTVVDITGVPSVGPGDVVTFLGSDGADRVTLDEIADLAGTIGYEVLTGFTPRLPRIWETPVGS